MAAAEEGGGRRKGGRDTVDRPTRGRREGERDGGTVCRSCRVWHWPTEAKKV